MTILLIGMSAIMLTTLTGGWLARKLGQSRVVGEIVGGILLGPSVFGHFAPNAANSLFPKSSFATFETLFTVGLILFLFLIGMELDHELLYRQRKTALLASAMSILLPFAMAILLAHSLRIRFAPQGIGSIPFTLFLGISMSITAFPGGSRLSISTRRASCMTFAKWLHSATTRSPRSTQIGFPAPRRRGQGSIR